MASLTTSIRIGMSNGRHNSASVAGMAAMVVSFRAVMMMMMMVASVDLLPEDQELCPGIRNCSKDNVLINFRVEVFYSTGLRKFALNEGGFPTAGRPASRSLMPVPIYTWALRSQRPAASQCV
ncbi:hypothetical protein EV424DRAFT_1349157 [Suillus variegatus]|nr:hypothetical protein EV424DRAFT_1349157 [Suillus variegatus]